MKKMKKIKLTKKQEILARELQTLFAKIEKQDNSKRLKKARSEKQEILARELQTLFAKIEKQDNSKRLKKARSEKQRAVIKSKNFSGKEKFRYVYFTKKDQRREKYLTIKQIKKLIPRGSELIFFPSEDTFRTIKNYKIKIKNRDRDVLGAIQMRDFDFLLEIIAPYYIKLFKKIKKPYEFFAFHLEYFDGEGLDRISTPLSDFDNLLVDRLDDEEIFAQFIKKPLTDLLLIFTENIEKYLGKSENEVYFTELHLKIYNDLAKKEKTK